jgi:Uma2 family endonuclease
MSETLLTQGADGLDRRAFTVDDLDAMFAAGILDREDKIELIRGEIVPMAPQNTPHFLIKSRIGRWFSRALAPEVFDVGVDGTVKLGVAGLFEPDVVILPRLKELKREYLPIAAALLVIEVADTSLKRDRDIKAPDYGAAGLPELWIVDLDKRRTLVWRQTPTGFAEVATIGFDEKLSPLFEPALALSIAKLE